MEFKIQRSAFLKSLSWTQSIAERKTTMPILSNTLLEAKGQNIKTIATDLDVGVVTQTTANIISEGKICVPAKSLYDIVKELNVDEIKISQKNQDRLEISSGKSSFKIVGMPSDDFPTLPQLDGKSSYPVEAVGLRDMLDKTLYAVSNDESRYNLHGVYLEKVGEKSLRMVATDGHRLSYVDREMSQAVPLQKGVIIPKKAVQELKKLVGASEEENSDVVKILIDGRNFVAERGEVTLVARLIDGDFPDYKPVIPKRHDKTCNIDRQELIGALRRVSLLVGDRSRGVKFSLSSGLMEISTSNPDLGEAHEELSVDYKGEKFHVGFNARYFLDILGVMNDPKTLIEFNGEVGPCVIRSEQDRGFLSVVMPMRI